MVSSRYFGVTAPLLVSNASLRLARIQFDIDGRDSLEIAAVISRLQPDAFHFVGDPLRRRFARHRAGPAAFKGVIGDRLVAHRKVGGGDLWRRGGMAGIGSGTGSSAGKHRRAAKNPFEISVQLILPGTSFSFSPPIW